jgi:hypothetical protein
MEIARLNALGTHPSTPDAQLRFEEAIKAGIRSCPRRNGTSFFSIKTASFGVGEPAELTTHAEEVVQDNGR